MITATALDAQRLVEEIAWFAPQLRVCLLPDWETLPYDQFSPHQDLVSERLATLYRIQRGEFDIAVVPASTALVRLCPPAYLAGAHLLPQARASGSSLEKLREQLAIAGYQHVTQVVSPGEVCFRGGLIDLFPMGSALPYRLDLDDDVIDAIRTFDVDTQRTLYAVKEMRLLPAREFPLDDAGRAQLPQPLARAVRRRSVEEAPLQRRLERRAGGRHRVLPAAVLRRARHAVRLPAGGATLVAAPRRQRRDRRSSGATRNSRYKLAGGDPDRPLLPPPQLFVPAEEFYLRAQAFPRIDAASQKPDEEGRHRSPPQPLPPVAVDRRARRSARRAEEASSTPPGCAC